MSEEKLKGLSLDILMELHSEAIKQLLESKRKMESPDVVDSYEKALALIQQAIVENQGIELPMK